MDTDQDFSFAFSVPPIVETVLKNLPIKDLNACAQVCKLWNSLAQTIKKRRNQLFWLFYVPKCSVHDKVHSQLCEFFEIDQEYCQDMEGRFRNQMNNVHSEPRWALLFCSKALHDSAGTYFASDSVTPRLRRKRHRNECKSIDGEKSSQNYPVLGSLLKYLPSYCKVTFCTSPGITGTSTNNKETLEIEGYPALAGLFFPNLPGVEIYQFSLKNVADDENFDIQSHTGIPEDTPVKCLLVFLQSDRGLVPGKIINHYLLKQNNKMAIGGAAVKRIYFPKEKYRCSHNFAIAFTGDKIEAASVVISASVTTKSEVEEKLRELLDSNLLNNRCIAFMFTCVARGFDFYGEYDVESTIFRKLFPTIPLLGVFGNGEVGMKYVPNHPLSKNVKQFWFHSYSTVFVLLSIKE